MTALIIALKAALKAALRIALYSIQSYLWNHFIMRLDDRIFDMFIEFTV